MTCTASHAIEQLISNAAEKRGDTPASYGARGHAALQGRVARRRTAPGALGLSTQALRHRDRRREYTPYGTSASFSYASLIVGSPARPYRALPDARGCPALVGPLGGPDSSGTS